MGQRWNPVVQVVPSKNNFFLYLESIHTIFVSSQKLKNFHCRSEFGTLIVYKIYQISPASDIHLMEKIDVNLKTGAWDSHHTLKNCKEVQHDLGIKAAKIKVENSSLSMVGTS